MSIAIIYLSIIVFITFIICLLYVRSIIGHNEEIRKIEEIEEKEKIKAKEIAAVRSKINKCPYINTDDPRSCYFSSGYRCSWNELGNICALR